MGKSEHSCVSVVWLMLGWSSTVLSWCSTPDLRSTDKRFSHNSWLAGWLAGGRPCGPQAGRQCTDRSSPGQHTTQRRSAWLVVVVVVWWDINIISPPVLHKSVIMLHDDMIIYHHAIIGMAPCQNVR